jgi:hypothetical protein
VRFVNRSSLVVPKALWRELADAMGLGGILPGVIAGAGGLYSSSTLRVTIHRERHIEAGKVVMTGLYTYGHITLSPCLHCTPAFLTQVYLHELAHAWLHQYHPSSYGRVDTCPLAERFAIAGFRRLGGRMRKAELCGSYSLPSHVSMARLREFDSLARSLSAPGFTFEGWHPDAEDNDAQARLGAEGGRLPHRR